MPTVLVTGANGFVGKALCKRLLQDKKKVRGIVRPAKASFLPQGVEAVPIDSINGDTCWQESLKGIDTVVHLAAHMPIRSDSAADYRSEYRNLNELGSARLALAASKCGVKRFIFMSSVKVNGDANCRAYKESDDPHPKDSYGISKMHAEQQLKSIAAESDMELVILRPPMIYGPGVKANFLELLKIVNKGACLPLANITNRRSFIYIENLLNAVVTCLENPGAAGQTYFVSDDDDVSTPELIRRIAEALGKPMRLFPFPANLIRLAGLLAGRSSTVNRLFDSLVVDISKIRDELNWQPGFKMKEGLTATANWFLKVLPQA